MQTTGFAVIDEVTGGFESGQVWIVVGTPGQGRSTLATQWALLLASQHEFATHLVSRRDPVRKVASRLAASAGRVPESHLWRQALSHDDGRGVERAKEVLGVARLHLAGPADISVVDADMPELALPQVLVVDDADLADGIFPQRVAKFAELGTLVVLTLPRSQVVTAEGIDPAWASVADFVLDIDRPDLFDRCSNRPGEADFHLLRNRWGPVCSGAVAFQGHYARFVEMAD